MSKCKKKILLVIHSFSPYSFPEAYLSAKCMGNITDYSVDVLTINAFSPDIKKDESLTSYVNNKFYKITRLNPPKWYKKLPFHRLKCFFSVPDQYVYLNILYFKYLKDLSGYSTIVTWSMYHSVHLLGLYATKKNKHISWIAHFSDPWVENPFFKTTSLIKKINTYFEKKVFARADRLIFTSLETVDLVLKNYPDSYRKKTYVVPHAFDESLYNQSFVKNNKFIIRYLGSFYGARQPHSFFKALEVINNRHPDILNKLQIEFVGSFDLITQESLPDILKPIVKFMPPVDYIESLQLMKAADLLLIIDAPFENSPFLPSKLIDYIGANRPVFGITPIGTSKKLIEKIGFLTAHPNNHEEIIEKFMHAVCSSKIDIDIAFRARYSVETNAKIMTEILDGIN